MSYLKIAVVSDLHCKHPTSERKGAKSTILYTDDIGLSEKKHPIKSLKALIETEKLTADIVLCPGDITDKSDNQGLVTGWSFLEKITECLKTEHLVATIGNHDVDSRSLTADNTFEKLKALDMKFPLPTKSANDHYWLEGFSFVEINDTLILVFNSCYSHRNSTKAQKSKIDQSILEKIETCLKAYDLTIYKYKVLLCHHHPINHANLDYADTDVIDKGDLLLALVNKYRFQICVHGHKHEPQLRILNKMAIFCAGSFSSLENVSENKGDNTFHIIYLKEDQNVGYIKTWVHLPKQGWISRIDSQFPAYVGFGFEGSIRKLAAEINDHVLLNGIQYLQFDDLLNKFSDLNFLGENDQSELVEVLSKEYNLMFEPTFPKQPRVLLKQVI